MTSEAAPSDPTPTPAAEHYEGHFKKELGLLDAVAVVVGSMIGSGIFITSAETARVVGAPGWLLICWILAGVLTVAAALCYSELASMYPKAGGQYVFLREAYGPLAGFLYGWTLFTVIQAGTIAAVGAGFAKFLGVFVPNDLISANNILLDVGGVWKLSTVQIVAVLLIAFLTFVNTRGVHVAKVIQTSFTVTKVCAIAGLIILGLFAFDKFHGLQPNLAIFWDAQKPTGEPLAGLALLLVLGAAMVGPLFSCDAWNNITFAGEEVKDSQNTLPRSLAIGTLTVAGIYLLANIVYLLLIPLRGVAGGEPGVAGVLTRGIQYAAEERVGAAAAQIIFGDIGLYLMAGAIMISTFGCLNGLILAGARVYWAMAKDGLFFAKAAHLDPNTNVPIWGLVIQGIWSAILATSGKYGDLLNYVVFAALLFYVLTVAAVFILRKKNPDASRPYKVPMYPILPALYIVATLAVMLGQIVAAEHPEHAGAGLLIIASGIPAYLIWKKKQGPAQTDS